MVDETRLQDERMLAQMSVQRPCSRGLCPGRGRIICSCMKTFCEKCWEQHQQGFAEGGCPDATVPSSTVDEDEQPELVCEEREQTASCNKISCQVCREPDQLAENGPGSEAEQERSDALALLELLKSRDVMLPCPLCQTLRSLGEVGPTGACKGGCPEPVLESAPPCSPPQPSTAKCASNFCDSRVAKEGDHCVDCSADHQARRDGRVKKKGPVPELSAG